MKRCQFARAGALGLAILAGVMSLPAMAAIVSFDYHVAYSKFVDGGDMLAGPVDPFSGDIHLSFDNSADITATKVTISNFAFTDALQPYYAYDASTDTLTFGNNPFPDGGNSSVGDGSFAFSIDHASTSPLVRLATYDTNGLSYSNRRGTASITAIAAPGAPAPLLGLGLLPALAGMGGLAATRRRRKAAISPAFA